MAETSAYLASPTKLIHSSPSQIQMDEAVPIAARWSSTVSRISEISSVIEIRHATQIQVRRNDKATVDSVGPD